MDDDEIPVRDRRFVEEATIALTYTPIDPDRLFRGCLSSEQAYDGAWRVLTQLVEKGWTVQPPGFCTNRGCVMYGTLHKVECLVPVAPPEVEFPERESGWEIHEPDDAPCPACAVGYRNGMGPCFTHWMEERGSAS